MEISNSTNFTASYLQETQTIIAKIIAEQSNLLNDFVKRLLSLRKRRGRLFIIGVGGGGAGNGSHAQGDFEKIANIDTTCLADNASSLTAYANDEGWETIFIEQLKRKNLSRNDAILVFSVGGGSDTTSRNIVEALKFAKEIGSEIFGIVGRDGGFTKQIGDCVVVIPPLYENHITGHTEEIHAVLWHMMVNSPEFKTDC